MLHFGFVFDRILSSISLLTEPGQIDNITAVFEFVDGRFRAMVYCRRDAFPGCVIVFANPMPCMWESPTKMTDCFEHFTSVFELISRTVIAVINVNNMNNNMEQEMSCKKAFIRIGNK